ncbi:MAG: SIMPL domain-containing protein [Defluviitaleaceae bacterium]|nr:SIMPL domain-containing protein [Defluviitaleaceae bacterium]
MRKTRIFATIMAVVMMGAVFAQPLAASSAPTITVNGAGAVSVTPDMATVNLGVSTQNASVQRALEENNILVATVIAAMLEIGIDEDDIRTASFWIDPAFGPDWTTITGFRVTNSVSVIVRDIEQVGDVLGAAVAAGANVSHGVSFGISDSASAYSQALALAVQNAEGKAQALAAALGRDITGIVSVVEMGGMHSPMARGLYGAGAVAEADMAWSSVPIEAGSMTVTASVQIVYSITP